MPTPACARWARRCSRWSSSEFVAARPTFGNCQATHPVTKSELIREVAERALAQRAQRGGHRRRVGVVAVDDDVAAVDLDDVRQLRDGVQQAPQQRAERGDAAAVGHDEVERRAHLVGDVLGAADARGVGELGEGGARVVGADRGGERREARRDGEEVGPEAAEHGRRAAERRRREEVERRVLGGGGGIVHCVENGCRSQRGEN